MKEVIIFGNNSFSKLLHYYLNEDNVIVKYFCVDDKYVNSDIFDGIPLLPYSKIKENYKYFYKYNIIIGIGYKKMNTIRQKVYNKLIKDHFKIGGFIHKSCLISKDSKIGVGNIFLENVTVQPFSIIGNCNLFWSNVTISHNDEIGDFNTFSANSSLSGNIQVKNNCFMGNNSTVRDGLIIDDFTLLGAGCYLMHNSEKYDVFKPAKIIKVEKKSTDIL